MRNMIYGKHRNMMIQQKFKLFLSGLEDIINITFNEKSNTKEVF